jgi:L-alanine-DL-glutamate epimerase-like enolase superfamily enzyme
VSGDPTTAYLGFSTCRGGIRAASAIDIALWDLAGKRHGIAEARLRRQTRGLICGSEILGGAVPFRDLLAAGALDCVMRPDRAWLPCTEETSLRLYAGTVGVMLWLMRNKLPGS